MKFLRILIVILACFGAARFAHKQTRGFKISHITDNFLPQTMEMTMPKEVETVLEKPFTFFNRGFQSFVFLSEDGKYVLKLLSNHYQRRIKLLSYLPFTQKKRESDLRKLEKTFQSYELAYSELKEETGLLYMHLNQTDLKKTIRVIDCLGIVHEIDLDNTAFLIQKCDVPVYTKLSDSNLEEAKVALSSLLGFMVDRSRKGIRDTDFLIRTNYGFIGEKPILFDVGSFVKDTEEKDPEIYKKGIEKASIGLEQWLRKNYPELSPHLKKELQKL